MYYITCYLLCTYTDFISLYIINTTIIIYIIINVQ